ncbi:MAG: ATP-binding protein [Bacteriovoracales bacterium]|nr:ATP-binding protein [Bacteriovoracales bacterium]
MSEKLVEKLKKKVSILEDILEDKTRNLFLEKEKVERYSKFFEAIIDSVHDIIIAIDEDGKVELINRAADLKLDIGGYGIGNLTIRKILGDELIDKIIEEKNNNNGQIEFLIRGRNDDKFPALVSRVPFKKNENRKIGYVYSIVDMTRLKEKEEIIEGQRAQLIQSTQLASLGEMAGGIAHEINNPVTIMDGQIRRLKDYLLDDAIDRKERLELLRKIGENLKRVTNIVSGIRKISRKGDGDKLVLLKVKEILESLKNLCNEKFKNRQIPIKFPEIDEKLTVMARETQLLQVLVNLVTNSSDAIENLDEKWIEIKVEKNNDKVLFRIIDSGLGIDLDVVKKIFNPFFTTKDIGKGTGIGLSISKKMMEGQKGDLRYELYKGHTSFVLFLNH